MAESQVPDTQGDTGVQRALGERRRRRTAERTGQVDLDSTMSHWPVTEPPTTPRPVVRPARPSVEGVATSPVLPTPGAMVVGPLLEARSAAAPRSRGAGSRRSRLQDAPAHDTGPVTIVPMAPDRAPADPRPTPVKAEAPTPVKAEAPAPVNSDVPTPVPAPVPSPVPAARAPRPLTAEAQRNGAGGLRRRVSWRAGLVLLAVVLTLVLAVVVVVVLALRGPGGDPAEAVAPVPEVPAQQTLALTFADGTAGRGLVGAALVGVDSAEVSTLLVPPDLLLTVADAGPVSVTEAALIGGEPVRRGLEDTLLLRVDGVALIQPAQLATLVDAVGGVMVDVTSEVNTGDVLVAVGDDQRLAGAQAAAYAVLAVEGEPAEARLARLGAVVQGLLEALPSDPADLGPTLQAAGVTATAGLGPDGLARLVASAAERAAAGNAEQVVLPTRELAAADAQRRGVDDEAARPELDSRFAGALLPVAAVGEVRVMVSNGVGRPGLGAAARDLLVADGLRYVGGGNVTEFGLQPQTVVLVPSQAQEDRDRGEAVAAALGLDPGALQVNRETLVDTDVVVVLGDDFARAVADGATGSAPPGTTPSGEAP